MVEYFPFYVSSYWIYHLCCFIFSSLFHNHGILQIESTLGVFWLYSLIQQRKKKQILKKKKSKTIELTILEAGTGHVFFFFNFIIKYFQNLNNLLISSFSSVVKPYGFVLKDDIFTLFFLLCLPIWCLIISKLDCRSDWSFFLRCILHSFVSLIFLM